MAEWLEHRQNYFCTSKIFWWEHIWKYHLSKICSLGANSEIFLLRLFSQDLPTLHQFYKEMFSAWYAIEDYVIFNGKESDVYNFCLFCNPKVTNKCKMLKWNVFIKAGVTHVKHIAYEVIPGFFTKFLYCWYYSVVWPWCKCIGYQGKLQNSFKKHSEGMDRICKRKGVSQHGFSCRLLCKIWKSIIVFSTCTVKIFYKLLVHKLFQHPVSKLILMILMYFSKDMVHYWSLINHLKLLNKILRCITMQYLHMKNYLKSVKQNQIVVQFAHYKMKILYIYLLAVMNYMNL